MRKTGCRFSRAKIVPGRSSLREMLYSSNNVSIVNRSSGSKCSLLGK